MLLCVVACVLSDALLCGVAWCCVLLMCSWLLVLLFVCCCGWLLFVVCMCCPYDGYLSIVFVIGVIFEGCCSLYVVCCLLWFCGRLLWIVGVRVCCALCACWLLLVVPHDVMCVGVAYGAAVWLLLVDCCWLLLRVV